MAKKATTKKPTGTTEKAKKTPAKKAPAREFSAGSTYAFKANGIAPSLKAGMVYKVSGVHAKMFTDNGWGEVID